MKQISLLCLLGAFFLTACQLSKEELFEKAAKDLTAQCPMVVDGCTYLDSLIYDRKDAQYQYYYSLHGFSDEDFMTLVTSPTFIEGIKMNIINSADMKIQKDYGLTFGYWYYSKESKKLLGHILITPSDYK